MTIEFFKHRIDAEKKLCVATEVHFSKKDLCKVSREKELESFRDCLEAYLCLNQYVFVGDFIEATNDLLDKICDEDFTTICFYIEENGAGEYQLLTFLCKNKKPFKEIENVYVVKYVK